MLIRNAANHCFAVFHINIIIINPTFSHRRHRSLHSHTHVLSPDGREPNTSVGAKSRTQSMHVFSLDQSYNTHEFDPVSGPGHYQLCALRRVSGRILDFFTGTRTALMELRCTVCA